MVSYGAVFVFIFLSCLVTMPIGCFVMFAALGLSWRALVVGALARAPCLSERAEVLRAITGRWCVGCGHEYYPDRCACSRPEVPQCPDS
jgi:hypothetical protein